MAAKPKFALFTRLLRGSWFDELTMRIDSIKALNLILSLSRNATRSGAECQQVAVISIQAALHRAPTAAAARHRRR